MIRINDVIYARADSIDIIQLLHGESAPYANVVIAGVPYKIKQGDDEGAPECAARIRAEIEREVDPTEISGIGPYLAPFIKSRGSEDDSGEAQDG